MKRSEYSKDSRKEKIVEKQNLEKRKQIKDKRFHVIEDDELVDVLFDQFLHGERNYDETDV